MEFLQKRRQRGRSVIIYHPRSGRISNKIAADVGKVIFALLSKFPSCINHCTSGLKRRLVLVIFS